MKRLWVAMALLILSAVICVADYMLINQECDRYTDIIQKAEEYVSDNDFDNAVKKCDTAQNSFDRFDSILNLFLLHGDVDEVTNNVAMLKKYAENKDKSGFLSLSAKTKRQLLSLKKSELPIFENIF